MPIGPNGERPGPGMPMDPGAPQSAPGAPPPATLDGADPGMGQFVSTDPAQMAAMAMQIIGQMAQMDQQKLQAMIQQVVTDFGARQQAAVMAAPDVIAQMVAQLGAGPGMTTLDGPAAPAPQPQDPTEPGMAG